jgi:hypothetical protein
MFVVDLNLFHIIYDNCWSKFISYNLWSMMDINYMKLINTINLHKLSHIIYDQW